MPTSANNTNGPGDLTGQMQDYLAEQVAAEQAWTSPELKKPHLDKDFVWTQNDFSTRGFSVPFWRVLQKNPQIMRNPNVSVWETAVSDLLPDMRKGTGFVVLPDLRSGGASSEDIINTWYDALTADMTAFEKQLYYPEIMRLLYLTAQAAKIEFTHPDTPSFDGLTLHVDKKDLASSETIVYAQVMGTYEWVALSLSDSRREKLQGSDAGIFFKIPFKKLTVPILIEASHYEMITAFDAIATHDIVAFQMADDETRILCAGITEKPPSSSERLSNAFQSLFKTFIVAYAATRGARIQPSPGGSAYAEMARGAPLVPAGPNVISVSAQPALIRYQSATPPTYISTNPPLMSIVRRH